MSLLELDTIKKRRVNKLMELELEPKLGIEEDKKYEVKAIKYSVIYVNAVKIHLLELYHLGY